MKTSENFRKTENFRGYRNLTLALKHDGVVENHANCFALIFSQSNPQSFEQVLSDLSRILNAICEDDDSLSLESKSTTSNDNKSSKIVFPLSLKERLLNLLWVFLSHQLQHFQ